MIYLYHFYYVAQDHIDSTRDVILDVDPEVVRKGVRSLMQQVAQIERERVMTILRAKYIGQSTILSIIFF